MGDKYKLDSEYSYSKWITPPQAGGVKINLRLTKK